MKKTLSNIVSDRILAMVSLAVYIISLILPIYVGLSNYATGDDLLYGSILRNAMRNGTSLGEMVRLVVQDVVTEYKTFQGTWSSQILWRLEPSIWGERIYVITIFLSLGILSLGIGYMLHQVLGNAVGLPFWSRLFIFSWILFFSIQYMPYPRGGLYWYTGMVQYTFAYGISMLSLGWAVKFMLTGVKRYLVYDVIALGYIGGAGYPVVVESGMILFFITIWFLLEQKGEERKRGALLFIPLAMVAIGFLISAAAPGNSLRGGEDYGFSIERVAHVMVQSIVDGVTYSLDYILRSRTLIFLPVAVALISISAKGAKTLPLKKTIIALVMGFLVVCYVHSPEIYAGETVAAGVSGGVYDIYYYVLVLYLAMAGYLIGGLLRKIVREKQAVMARTVFFIFVVLFCVVFRRFLVGSMLDYTCFEYVRSGQLKDFTMQMEERLVLLEDDEIQDVVLPEMNDQQGPLMHMALTSDPKAYTNYATGLFYDKNSIIAIDRNKWNEEYKDR